VEVVSGLHSTFRLKHSIIQRWEQSQPRNEVASVKGTRRTTATLIATSCHLFSVFSVAGAMLSNFWIYPGILKLNIQISI